MEICPFCAELDCLAGQDYCWDCCGSSDCRQALKEQNRRDEADDDGLSDRSSRVRDSFAYDNHGHDTGLRESDFI